MATGRAVRLQPNWTLHKYVLGPEKILELFHAVALDKGTATVAGTDPDLSDQGGEQWAKAVARSRKLWIDGLPLRPDKN